MYRRGCYRPGSRDIYIRKKILSFHQISMSAWKPMTVCSDVLTIPVGGTALASRDSRSTKLIIQRVYVSTTLCFGPLNTVDLTRIYLPLNL